MAPVLPLAAYKRAEEIAAAAPPFSPEKIARLQLIAWGMPAGASVPAEPDPGPAEAA
jgi:hypothetical protein